MPTCASRESCDDRWVQICFQYFPSPESTKNLPDWIYKFVLAHYDSTHDSYLVAAVCCCLLSARSARSYMKILLSSFEQLLAPVLNGQPGEAETAADVVALLGCSGVWTAFFWVVGVDQQKISKNISFSDGKEFNRLSLYDQSWSICSSAFKITARHSEDTDAMSRNEGGRPDMPENTETSV